jgi:WD40 repeat protein/tRNA A-37 threonylcarbamoyl transferase component Bud32
MAPDEPSDERDPIERLAEEFVARHRRGNGPSAAEYAKSHPQWADRILALFPALLLMEGHKPGASDLDGSCEGGGAWAAPLEQLGDYRIIREVGRGGMAVVYEAEQKSLGRHVALKVLRVRPQLDPRWTARFRREARTAARLHHTNIVPVYGVGEHDGVHYYVMQFIAGQALDEVLREMRRLRQRDPAARPSDDGHPRRGGDGSLAASATEVALGLVTGRLAPIEHEPWDSGSAEPQNERPTDAAGVAEVAAPPAVRPDPETSSPPADDGGSSIDTPGRGKPSSLSGPARHYWRGVARIGVQVAEALEYAHAQGVLHRDIKPSNLLLDLHGTAWVADFGLAKPADQEDLTDAGDVVGTWRYMAPERFQGLADARSDVYSLGLTLYELLALRPAFEASTREELIRQVSSGVPPRLRRVNPEVPRDLETVVLKAIERDPARRYRSAGELAEDLRRFLEDRPIRARRASLGERAGRWCRRNPALAGVTALAAALLIAVAAVSSIGYIRISAALAREETHLYHALVGEARALRMARQGGYRRQAWDRLAQALRLATPDRDVGTLRREAVACLGDFVGLDPAVIEGFHPSRIIVLALHPGGEQVAIGLKDGGVHVRRIADGRPVAVLSGPASPVFDVAFGPEGRTLMSQHADGTLQLCTPDPARGWVCSRTVKVGEEMAPSLVASGPRRFVFVRRDKAMMLRNLADGRMIRLETRDADDFLFGGIAGNAALLGPRSDCPYAALPYLRGGPDEREPYGIVVWDVATGRERRRLPSPIGEGNDLSFSPDFGLMACGCDEGLLVYELPSFRQRFVVRSDTVQNVRFSPDGQYLAASTLSGMVKIWSTSTDREVATLAHAGDGLYHALAFSDDGRALAVSGERKVRVWNLAGTTERQALAGHSGGVTSVVFSPDGTRLASTSKDQTVRIWDPATGRLCRTLPGYSHRVETAAFSPDGRMLATGDRGGRIRLWDTRSWAELDAPRDEGLGEAISVAFSPDGNHFAGSGDKGMTIWRLTPGGQTGDDPPRPTFEPTIRLPVPLAMCVAFSPDGGLVAFVHKFRGVHLWDLANRREVPLRGPELLSGYGNLSFRPGSRQLAFVTSRGVGEVWDTTTGTRVLSLGGDGAFASPTSSVSPGGRWFAGEATPAGVALWDLGRQELAFSLREERSTVWSHAWTPDERRLALGLSDGGLCIWDLHEVLSRLDELGLGWR